MTLEKKREKEREKVALGSGLLAYRKSLSWEGDEVFDICCHFLLRLFLEVALCLLFSGEFTSSKSLTFEIAMKFVFN